ncbi:MAG TPA: hypothetical protein DEO70_12215 [Bacteroidales bacterium]|nr:MAG: hypothetical protein A2X11_10210 [Bacteroidetes bacterium GWE2_42_24]OFY25884.1 MAG: hypothetical protein A2X09_09585 [Bacteroidetes bacterium GWF2_43_11]HBZ67593.1 hypothetical protein [Bacteroidales bacterium]
MDKGQKNSPPKRGVSAIYQFTAETMNSTANIHQCQVITKIAGRFYFIIDWYDVQSFSITKIPQPKKVFETTLL